ncbi:MAG: peptidase S41 [Planctomycetes bacterium]|nr:peptidase S41 [Planctomycetota bacterium]
MKFLRASLALLLNVLVLLSPYTDGKEIASESQEIQNFKAFVKIYGYVKYFHPSDQASHIDWEKFAVYGTEKVKSAQNNEELKVILEELFIPIAPTIQIYHSNEKPRPFGVPEDTTDLKVVAWQHQGVGIGTSSHIYRSIRINRENRISIGGYGFGTVTQSVDAMDYRGKEIKLRAYVRTNVSGTGNQGQLWLRVDRNNGQNGFFDNMNDRPIKSNDWQLHEIVGTVTDDATKIVFGCFLNGMGQVWVDKFQLFAKNKARGWETVQIKNPGFEEDTDKRPKIWFANSPGYTYKLISDNPYEGERSLLIENKDEDFSGTLFNALPKVGEVINKELGAGLSCQIPLALYSDSNGTIGQGDKGSFDALLEQLSKIETDKLTADNEFVRLANIVIAWNVFQHFYPYFDVVDTDWNVELTNSLTKALSNQSERDFYATLRQLVAELHDGHGGVYHKISREQSGFPFLVDWIENHVIITFVRDSYNFKIGDIILSLDGMPAEQMLLNEEKFISGSPQWKRINSLKKFGFGKEGTIAKIKIMRNGQILRMEAVRNNKDRLSELGRPIIEEVENDIYYINLDKAEMDEIREKIDDLAHAKGVIFDLRGYPKGNHEVISHLLTEPDTSSAWMRVPQIIYPDHENVVGFTKYGWNMEPKEPHIKGKVVFLTDSRAISYAESFLSFIEHYKLAEIVGQSTAGTNGNVNPFELPGGFRIVWTAMKVVKHDGSQHHLIGIQPTVPVQRTIQGVIEGRDEYLEKALEIIKNDS